MRQARFYLLLAVGLRLSAGDQCPGPATDATPTGPALDASSGLVLLATKSVVEKGSLVPESVGGIKSEGGIISALLQDLTVEMHNYTSLTQKSDAGLALASELAFDSVVSLVKTLRNVSKGNGTATPFGNAISRVRIIINDTMRATIQGAHDRDVKELATLSTSLGQCRGEHLTGSQLATLKDFKNQALASTHKTCRSAEGVLATKKATCDADVISKKLIKDTQCAVPDTLLKKTAQQYYNEWVPNVGEGTKAYIDRMTITINSKDAEITAAQRACTNATTNHSSAVSSCSTTNSSLTTKRQTCDTAQERLEERTCNWRKVAGNMCDGYTDCHATRSASLTEAIRIITGNVQDRKAEWRGLARIDCLLDAFANGKVNQTEIDTCKGLTHSAADMNITMPAVPTPTNCTSTYPVIPCSAEWVRQEYSGLPTNAPAKACSPCQLGPAPPTQFGKSDKMPDCTNSRSLFAADYMGFTDAAVTPSTGGPAGECGFSLGGNANAVLAYPLEEGSAFTSVTCTIYGVANEYGMTLLVDGETPTPRKYNDPNFLATCYYANRGVEGWLDGCIKLTHSGTITPYAKTPGVPIGGRWDTRGSTRITMGTSSQWKKLTIKLEGGRVIFSYATEVSGGAEKVLTTWTAPHAKFYVGLSSVYGITGSTCVMNPGVVPTTPAPTTTTTTAAPTGPVAAFGTSDKIAKCSDAASEFASDYMGFTDAALRPFGGSPANGDCAFKAGGNSNVIMAHPIEEGGFYNTVTCKLYSIPNEFGMTMLVDGEKPTPTANNDPNMLATCSFANRGTEAWLDGCIRVSHNGQITPYARPSSGSSWDRGGEVRAAFGSSDQYKKVRMVATGGKVQFWYAVESKGGAFTKMKEWTPPLGHSKWYIALSSVYGINGANCQMSKSQVPAAV